jgi:glycosyltransferase 2 family protein
MSDAETSGLPRATKRRRLWGTVVVLLVLAALAVTVARNWDDFADSWRRIGVEEVALALGLILGNLLTTWLQWRTVLTGLGVELRTTTSARVFFVSQVGKYVPGAVWPLVLQVESSRREGADRKAVVAGNAIVLAISLATGLVVAGVLLPFSVPSALGRFWWALAALPLVALAAHPSTLPALLDGCLRRLGRKPLGVRLSGRTTLRAMFWSLVAWGFAGAQTWVLARAAGAEGSGLLALCTGGTALAVSAGILFLPAPAGTGPREVVLVYVLTTVMPGSAALAVVVASRVILVAADLLMAAVGMALPAGRSPHASTPRTGRLRLGGPGP